MSEKTLELTIALKADDMTLQKIQDQLSASPSGRAALADLLNEWLKEQAAGLSPDVKVDLRAVHLIAPYGAQGLNANEWLESQKFSRHPAGKPSDSYSTTLD